MQPLSRPVHLDTAGQSTEAPVATPKPRPSAPPYSSEPDEQAQIRWLLSEPQRPDVRLLLPSSSIAALGMTEVQVMPDRHPVEFVTEIAEKVLPRLSSIG